MLWNIFKFEFKRYLGATLGWSLSLIALSAFFLAMYPALIENSANFRNVIDAFPEALKSLTGFTTEALTSLIGYYGLLFTYVMLFGAIQAMQLGAIVLGKEGKNHTSEFLLTKPVSRRDILTSKLLAVTALIALTNALVLPVEYFLMRAFFSEPISTEAFLLTSLTLLYVQLVFLALGFFAAALLKRIKSPLTLALPAVFGFYIVGMLDSVVGKEEIRYFTPFKFYDFRYIQAELSYEYQFLILSITIVAALVIFSYRIYLKKDISTL